MPSMLMLQDSMFPRFTDEVSDSERLDVMQDYLYQLLEQLRYTLTNLGEENFNTVALGEIGEDITKELDGDVEVIRKELVGINGTLYGAATGDGIVARLESAEGSVSTLTATAAQLTTDMSDVKGNLLSLSATASALELQIKGTQGSVTTLEATANGLSSSVTQLEETVGNIDYELAGVKTSVSTFEQTAEGLEAEVGAIYGLFDVDEEGAVMPIKSTFKQLAEEISLSVSNNGTSSTITLNAFGAEITSGKIKLTGVVTFDDLESSGSTVINGDNITTGTITGTDLELKYKANEDDTAGIIFKYGSLICGYMKLFRFGEAPTLYLGTYNNGVGLQIESPEQIVLEVGNNWLMINNDGVFVNGDPIS